MRTKQLNFNITMLKLIVNYIDLDITDPLKSKGNKGDMKLKCNNL